jgi:hypothetical protein
VRDGADVEVGDLLGVPVGAWGGGYYVGVLALAIAGLTGASPIHAALSRDARRRHGGRALFSLWLTYLELFVIHAICQWCVVSAILATILFVVSWLDCGRSRAAATSRCQRSPNRCAGSFGARIRNTSEVALRAIETRGVVGSGSGG